MRRFTTLVLVIAIASPITAGASPGLDPASHWISRLSGLVEAMWTTIVGGETEPGSLTAEPPDRGVRTDEQQESAPESEAEVFPGWDPVG